MLLGNFDMLMAFINKHCQECPSFAQEFEQLNRDVAQHTMANLQKATEPDQQDDAQ